MVALAFAVATGFGFEKVLGDQLLKKLSGQEEVAEKIIGFAHWMLENTRGGAIAGVDIVVLLWTVIKVLGNIEKSFNDLGREDIQNPRAQICRLCLDDDLPGVVDHRQQRDRIGRHAGDRVSRAAFVAGSGGRGSDRAPQIFALWVLWLVFTLIYVFMPTPRFS